MLRCVGLQQEVIAYWTATGVRQRPRRSPQVRAHTSARWRPGSASGRSAGRSPVPAHLAIGQMRADQLLRDVLSHTDRPTRDVPGHTGHAPERGERSSLQHLLGIHPATGSAAGPGQASPGAGPHIAGRPEPRNSPRPGAGAGFRLALDSGRSSTGAPGVKRSNWTPRLRPLFSREVEGAFRVYVHQAVSTEARCPADHSHA